MIKYLFILVNSLALFVLGWISGEGIGVTANFPDVINAGQETKVQLVISKGDLSGFGKLQIEMHEGLNIVESDDQGASYTYNEGTAKWIWATLTPDEEIVINLTIVASVNSIGTHKIRATFSYVEDNVKKETIMTPAEVTVVSSGIVSESQPPQSNPGDSTNIQNPDLTAGSNREPPGDIRVSRYYTKPSPMEVIVNLRISKGNTRGFARYSDDLPEGFIARSIKTDGSSFSVADRKIKFVWVNVPEKEELEIAYSITATRPSTLLLDGEYSYLEANQSQKFKLDKETITLGAVAVEEVVENKEPEVKKKVEKGPDTNIVKEALVPKPSEKKKKRKETKEESPVLTANTVVKTNFVVQIGAFANPKVDAAKLQKLYKISDRVDSEMHQGLFKFMVGTYGIYKEARDHREILISGNGVKGAFVAAYNESKRITVQEALMITNQKWFR